MLSTWIDFLATRVGFFVAMCLVCLGTLAAGAGFHRAASGIQDTQVALENHRSAKANAALSDLLRLTIILHDARLVGHVSPEIGAEFSAALDIIHVRAEHIRTRLERFGKDDPAHAVVERKVYVQASGEAAVAALLAVTRGGDAAIASGFADLDKVSGDTLGLTTEARRAVYQYIDETGRLEEQLEIRHSAALISLARWTWVFLGAITLAGAGCLHLFRREVLGRKQRERAESRAEYLAYFDTLTGVPNRVQFQDRVTSALSMGSPASILLIDIDNFKEINDRMGHAMADAVLKEIGHRVRTEAEASGGFVARSGGDEFAVFLPRENPVLLERMCRALIEECARPVSKGGDTVHPGVSIGAASSTMVGVTTLPKYEMIMRIADFALYAAKLAGRGCHTIYDKELEQRFIDRKSMIEDLPDAIKAHELEVYLQPKVDIATAQVFGFEALVRWRRNGGIVPPVELIKVAEESGLILDLDRYMLDRATSLMSDWNRRHRTGFSISVNLSALHLLQGDAMNAVPEVLSRYGLPPDLLTLEITETVQLDNWDRVSQALSVLRQTGCRIAIDDFGTGYSSLAYLRAISADELKIDKSLVAEIETSTDAQVILEAVCKLAGSLKMDVVVEGIERESQARLLLEMDFVHGQGFLYGRPRPAADWLADVTYGPSRDADDGEVLPGRPRQTVSA
jgi:diguanylate cyclase (GGDEF)-like protein